MPNTYGIRVTATTPAGNLVAAWNITAREWSDCNGYEEDWEGCRMDFNGIDVAPWSWRGQILMAWLEANGDKRRFD